MAADGWAVLGVDVAVVKPLLAADVWRGRHVGQADYHSMARLSDSSLSLTVSLPEKRRAQQQPMDGAQVYQPRGGRLRRRTRVSGEARVSRCLWPVDSALRIGGYNPD